ncbi:MAG TPA: M28 family peptidase [Cyclobacteriaceae bacterium]|nr:M28 family peptidase [Cyclobacteriaceae bacterium]
MTETSIQPIPRFDWKILRKSIRFRFVLQIAIFLITSVNKPSFVFSQSLDYARSVIGELCSPRMYGRGYSLKGDSIAAAYIKEEFRRSGILPPGNEYDQVFEISANVFPAEVTLHINHESLIPGKDFVISPSSPSLHGEFMISRLSPHVLLSRKLLPEFLRKANDKAILIDRKEFASLPDSVIKELDQFIHYLANERTSDPAAILIAGTGKLTWSAATYFDERPVIYIDALPKGRPKKSTIRIDQQFMQRYQTRNVIGMIPARINTDSFLVVTAHYDHLGTMGLSTYFQGANDNASGTALMLDLARELSVIRDSLNYSLIFIAFSGEESGLLGSQYFSEHPVVDLKKIRFLINLDLAGTGDEGITVVNATVFNTEFELLKKINEEKAYLPAIKSRGEACNSDHCFLYRKGVPCFYFYTLGGISAYHDIYDRAETLPLTAYNNYFALVKQFILRIGSNNGD